ncbi:hypothetical protein J2T38_001706 [Neisseria perflava]|uniref:hypothetical protein n=1 Tax=Neisseria perflava TaxID=33053 RepID=UPI00209FFB7E|nr:hypothetical protein [Neisseria perflava]MCP1772870.1 hypothetical protein [Neisseria perflava]
MTTYHELVQRVLAGKQADIELGLARAREQKPFVEQVSRVLDRLVLRYTVRMDGRFGVIFCLETEPADIRLRRNSVAAAMQRYAVAQPEGADKLYLSCLKEDGIVCRIVFGDIPQ